MDKLDFRNCNPGAVQFGNFINYYQFNPVEERINQLPDNIWNRWLDRDFFGLDLGCNSGNLTVAIYDFLRNKVKNCNLLGVDIDPVLIQRAKEQNPNHERIQFYCQDFMDETIDLIEKYMCRNNLEKFSAIFCFSVTMWIHLNHSDQGLERFLKTISSLSDLIIVEPQPWKCYRTAVKRLKSANDEFPYFKQLKIRHNIEEFIENFLINNCDLVKIYDSPRTKWGRKLLAFTSKM